MGGQETGDAVALEAAMEAIGLPVVQSAIAQESPVAKIRLPLHHGGRFLNAGKWLFQSE
jgi:hypothetical protein